MARIGLENAQNLQQQVKKLCRDGVNAGIWSGKYIPGSGIVYSYHGSKIAGDPDIMAIMPFEGGFSLDVVRQGKDQIQVYSHFPEELTHNRRSSTGLAKPIEEPDPLIAAQNVINDARRSLHLE